MWIGVAGSIANLVAGILISKGNKNEMISQMPICFDRWRIAMEISWIYNNILCYSAAGSYLHCMTQNTKKRIRQ